LKNELAIEGLSDLGAALSHRPPIFVPTSVSCNFVKQNDALQTFASETPAAQYSSPHSKVVEPTIQQPVPRTYAIPPYILIADMFRGPWNITAAEGVQTARAHQHEAFETYEPVGDGGGRIKENQSPIPCPSSTPASRCPSPWQKWANSELDNDHCDLQVDGDAGGPSNANHTPPLTVSGAAVTLGTPTNVAHPAAIERGFQGNDNDSSDEEVPDPKRPRKTSAVLSVTPIRARFACPYQKFDPTRCRFCCSPHSKNQEGGADTMSRLR